MSTAIGFDPVSGALIIVGNGVFPAGTLTASPSAAWPDRIQIDSLAGRGEQVVLWSDVTSLDGAYHPNSLNEALAYLQGEFARSRVTGSPQRDYALSLRDAEQATFPLSPEPVDVNTVALVVNGIAYYPPDTAVSPIAVTWQGPFPLAATDAVRVVYF